jgi:diguanylate cyclase (GGDEF)-like protein
MAAVDILRSAIDSIAKAELLEFFHNNRGAFDTAEQLAVWAGRDARELVGDLDSLATSGILRREGDGAGAIFYFRPDGEMEAVLPAFLESVRKGSRRTEILKIEKENAALKAISSRLEAEIAARDRSLDEIRSQLEAQYRRLLFIQKVSNVILASATAADLFGALSTKLTEAASFDAAAFLLLDEKVKIFIAGREGYPPAAFSWISQGMRQRFEGVLPVSMIPEETVSEILQVTIGPKGAEAPGQMIHAPLFREKKPTGLVALVRGGETAFADDDTRLLEIVATQLSIALENLYAREQVARLAITDDLTGIYNKRQFRQTLKYEFEKARVYAEPLSLIMLDIDHFKRVNDTWGHGFGDIILSELCGVVRQQIRPTDTLARYGGEEFAVILPHTDRVGAISLAERIRRSIEENEFPPPESGSFHRVTVSAGVAEFNEGFSTPDDLVANADRNLYRSKNSGRNRVSG